MRSRPRTLYFNPAEGMVAVKAGFSWPAFLFGSLWAAARRMWLPYFAAMSVVDVALWFVTGYAEGQGHGVLALAGLAAALAYAVIRGRFGNRWLAASLVRRGYRPEAPPARAG